MTTIVYKYIKALTPIRLFNGALWLEEEDISRLPEDKFNLPEIQTAIANDELVEVNENDLPVDVVSPTFKLRGEWDPSNGQLPTGRRIGDTYLISAIGTGAVSDLVPGMRVLFRDINTYEILGGVGGGGGGGSSLAVKDEGVQISATPTFIDFTGEGVITSTSGAGVSVNIPGNIANIVQYDWVTYTDSPFLATSNHGLLIDAATLTYLPSLYPLDATLAEIQASTLVPAGINDKLVMSDLDQTGTYTLQGSLPSLYHAAAGPTGLVLSGAALDLSVGGVNGTAIEVGYTYSAGIDGGTGSGMYLHLISPISTYPMLSVIRQVDLGIESVIITKTLAGPVNTTLYTHPTGADTVALRFDGTTVRVWIDNVEVTLSDSAWTDVNLVAALHSVEVSSLPPTDAGKTFSATLRTSAENFVTTALPAGTVDPAGNSATGISVLLPATPAVNDIVRFIPVTGQYSVNNLTIGGNGKKVGDQLSDVLVNTDDLTFDMVYMGEPNGGWLAVSLGSTLFVQKLSIAADITEVVDVAGTAITLNPLQVKKVLRTTSNTNGTVTLPLSTDVSIGWQTAVQQGGDGIFTFSVQPGDTLVALDDYVKTLGKGAIVTVIKTAANTWWIGGGLGV